MIRAAVWLGVLAVAGAAFAAAADLIADVNCDGAGSAADFAAMVMVSADGSRFPSCLQAGPFRNVAISDGNLIAVLHDVFGTLNPRWTATPAPSPTRTATPPPTGTSTLTPAVSATATASTTASSTASSTPTDSPTRTNTPTMTPTRTPTKTRTPAPTSTPTATRTPTGLASQLAGDWFANWTNQTCFLDGQPFAQLLDTTYRVTAVAGTLDIIVPSTGDLIGRGLIPDTMGTVTATVQTTTNTVCPVDGQFEEFDFKYTFTFHANGTGTAVADWGYGRNQHCASCSLTDTAVLQRVH